MIIGNVDNINSPVRSIKAKVELYNGSTLVDTFNTDKIIEITIERTGEEGSFFGFGICQHAKVDILDTGRELEITTANSFKVIFDDIETNPIFYVTQTRRDEATNTLSIYGYDFLHLAANKAVDELALEVPYNLEDVAASCASFLGGSGVNTELEEFYLEYEVAANLEGTETLREVLDDIAEITGTFYFVNSANELVFKRLEQGAAASYQINRDRYFTLESGDNRRLSDIISTTELGDNIQGNIFVTTFGTSVLVDDVSPLEHEVETHLIAKDLVNPFNRDYSYTRYGVTKTVKAGSKHIWIDGTAEASSGRNDMRNYADKFTVEAGKRYVLEVKVLNSTNHDRLDGYITKNNSSYTSLSNCSCLQGTKEFVADETIECFIGINAISGNTYNNLEVSITVREKRTDFTGVVVSVSVEDGVEPNTFEANPDGTVAGISAHSPNMGFTTNDDTTEVVIRYAKINKTAGTTQYIRDNSFLDLREDRAAILDDLVTALHGLTINQFSCTWRGNYLLELGDKVELETKDNDFVTSFLLDDTIKYNGAFEQSTKWEYNDSEETEAAPSTLGDVLKATYAKVDKANAEIAIVAGNVSSLQVSEAQIKASVTEANKDIGELINKVNATMSAEQVEILIQQEILGGVDSVTTATGFTFNSDGLNVSKDGTEIETLITEDGMSVYKGSEEVLTANNQGVKAEDLHATTFLIIGTNSRLENYDSGRTGCFWIGG